MSAPRQHLSTTGRVATLGFWALVASEALSVVVSLAMLASPSVLPQPWLRSGDGDVLIRAWAITWLALSSVLLCVLLTSVRRGERWARLVMVTVPGIWFAHYLLAPGTVHNLALALVTSGAWAAAALPRRQATRRSPG